MSNNNQIAYKGSSPHFLPVAQLDCLDVKVAGLVFKRDFQSELSASGGSGRGCRECLEYLESSAFRHSSQQSPAGWCLPSSQHGAARPFRCTSLNNGCMLDRQAATIPTAGSMHVHTLGLTWVSSQTQKYVSFTDAAE